MSYTLCMNNRLNYYERTYKTILDYLSDIDYAKCNRSIFTYAKNSSNLVLKKGIKVSADIPKVVKNKVDPRCIKSRKNHGLNVI